MLANIFKIKSEYILIDLFEYMPLDQCLKLIRYNKRLHRILNYDYNLLANLEKMIKVVRPNYESIVKYIPKLNSQNNQNIITFVLNNPLFLNEQLFYKAINSIQSIISIDIKNHKYWKTFIKNIINIRLEINPSIITYIYNMQEKEKRDTFDYLKKYIKNIKEVYFDSFIDKNEINFEMRNKIKFILKNIFFTNNKAKKDNYMYINKISFGDNSIISIFDINNIFIEITDILYNNNKYLNIYNFGINSKTANNNITNINTFISTKMPNLQFIQINDFTFINNNNASKFSNLFRNLKFLNKIDLSGSLCDNDNLIEILNNKNLELKELKLKIFYSDKIINWNFLSNFIKFLEILEIELVFPYTEPSLLSYQFCFDYKYNNTKDLFLMVNKMNNLKKLKLIGEYLNNYDLNFLENNNLSNIIYSFYIINPELPINKKYYYVDSSISKIFQYYNHMKEITLIYNYYKQNYSISDKYNGIDLLCDFNKEKAFKLILFEFPPNLSIIKIENFVEPNFIPFYLIPLLNKNKDKLSKIRELKLNNCYIELYSFEKFLSILPLMTNLRVLSINNIVFYEKFKMKNLLSYIPKILKNTPNLIELDFSNNKYKEKIFLDANFINIKKEIPHNLISLRIFNKQIPISNNTLKVLKYHFGRILLDYENAVVIKNI